MLHNKKLIRILPIILLAIFLSGCKFINEKEADTDQPVLSSDETEVDITKEPANEEDIISPTPEITSEPQAVTDKTDDSTVVIPGVQSKEVINNGGLFVKYKGYTYYRQYNADSFDAEGLWANYYAIPGVSKNMMRLKEDGTYEIAFSDDGAGEIYISNDRIYLQKPTDYGNLIYSVNLDGSNPKDIGMGNILGIDSATGILVCMFQNEKGESILATVNGISGEITEITLTVPCNEVLKVHDGFIYYSGIVDYEKSAYGKMKLCKVAIDGTNELLLAESEADLYDFETYGTEIPCIQIVEDTIYFSYGGYAGSGIFYQGGVIAKVDKDGGNYEVLLGSPLNSWETISSFSDTFYVAKDNGQEFLYYSALEGETYKLNLSTREATITRPKNNSEIVSPEGIPFESNDRVLVYQNASASATSLIRKVDYTSLGFDSNLDYYYTIKDIEQVENWVYYRIEANEYSEDASIGWRDGYRRIKTQVIREEIGREKKEILFEY